MSNDDDLLKHIPRPDELPKPPEPDVDEWLARIIPPLGELMKLNASRLHAGKSLRLKINGTTKEMWLAQSHRVVQLFETQGYEATPVTEGGMFLELRLKK